MRIKKKKKVQRENSLAVVLNVIQRAVDLEMLKSFLQVCLGCTASQHETRGQ